MYKNRLKDILDLDDRIDSKLRQLGELRATIEGIRSIDYSQEKIKASPTSTVENTIMKVLDYEEEINKDIDKLIDMKDEARIKINKVKGKYGTILEMRYLECMRWEEIAYRLCYDIRHIHRLHGEALMELQRYHNRFG